jgi:hypothetical protein
VTWHTQQASSQSDQNKTHDDTKFTQYTIAGSSVAAQLNDQDLQYVENVTGQINEMMQRYMRR